MAAIEEKLCVLLEKLKETDHNLSVCIVLLQQYIRSTVQTRDEKTPILLYKLNKAYEVSYKFYVFYSKVEIKMKFLVCIIVLATVVYGEEEKKNEKRGLLGFGYGHDFGYGGYAAPLAHGHGYGIGHSFGHGYGHGIGYAAPLIHAQPIVHHAAPIVHTASVIKAAPVLAAPAIGYGHGLGYGIGYGHGLGYAGYGYHGLGNYGYHGYHGLGYGKW